MYGEYGGSGRKWVLEIDGNIYNRNIQIYRNNTFGNNIIVFSGSQSIEIAAEAGTEFTIYLVTVPAAVRWFRGNGSNFRGAVIEYHAYSVRSGTIIGTIHIARDNSDNCITHTETGSGSSSLSQIDMWYRDNNESERDIYFRRLDNESDTLKVHWIAKMFYGNEYYD